MSEWADRHSASKAKTAVWKFAELGLTLLPSGLHRLWSFGFGGRSSHSPGWLPIFYAAEDNLELLILVPLLGECWVTGKGHHTPAQLQFVPFIQTKWELQGL